MSSAAGDLLFIINLKRGIFLFLLLALQLAFLSEREKRSGNHYLGNCGHPLGLKVILKFKLVVFDP